MDTFGNHNRLDSHVNDVVLVVFVLESEVFEQLHFDRTLVVEPLLVPNDLERNMTLFLVVKTLDHVTKRTVAKPAQHLKAVPNMIVLHHLVAGLPCETLCERRNATPSWGGKAWACVCGGRF